MNVHEGGYRESWGFVLDKEKKAVGVRDGVEKIGREKERERRRERERERDRDKGKKRATKRK